jgi:hypothetical protein
VGRVEAVQTDLDSYVVSPTFNASKMFYNYRYLQINCQVVPNTDVSGVDVRWALFIQAFTTIILSLEPLEIFMTNTSTQGTSLALIAATFFDLSVDVP